MELIIFWTRLAENKIEDIYQYYSEKVSVKTAKKTVNGIIDSTSELRHSPYIGQIEPLLINRRQEFRYLIFKKYKIIYWINENNKRIEIANIFDCRQNPTVMKETK